MQPAVKQTWFSRRAIGLHAVIVVIVPTFFGLCVWQVTRALSGNQLSWAYVFEWPFFAGYAIYMWWRFVHEDCRGEPNATSGPAAAGRPRRQTPTPTPEDAGAMPTTGTSPSWRRRQTRKQWR